VNTVIIALRSLKDRSVYLHHMSDLFDIGARASHNVSF